MVNVKCLKLLITMLKYRYSLGLLFILKIMFVVNSEDVNCTNTKSNIYCSCNNTNQTIPRSQFNGEANELEISNCSQLTIQECTIFCICNLQKVSFKNIANLTLEKNSLHYPTRRQSLKLQLYFENVNVNVIDSDAITGEIDEIIFNNSKINKINSSAINITHKKVALKFNNCEINSIRMKAFEICKTMDLEFNNISFYFNSITHLFIVNSLKISFINSDNHECKRECPSNIENVNINVIHSNAITGQTDEIIFNNSKINKMNSAAINFSQKNVSLNCEINSIEIMVFQICKEMGLEFNNTSVYMNLQSESFDNNIVHDSCKKKNCTFNFEIVNVNVIYSNATDEINFNNSKINTINSSAINISQKNVSLTFNNCEINSNEMMVFQICKAVGLEFKNTSFYINLQSKSFYKNTVHDSYKKENCSLKLFNSKVVENQVDKSALFYIIVNTNGSVELRNNNFSVTYPAVKQKVSVYVHHLKPETLSITISHGDGSHEFCCDHLTCHHLTCDITYAEAKEKFGVNLIIVNIVTILILTIAIIVIVFYCKNKKKLVMFPFIMPEFRTYREAEILFETVNDFE